MIDWYAEQSDKFIGTAAAIAAAIAAGASTAGGVYAAHKSGEAAEQTATAEAAAQKYAADLQSKATAEALAFSKQQGENAFQNSEAARHGNYDMYAAAQRRLGSLGSLIGAPAREIPAYVPGVDPAFTGSTTPPTTTGAGDASTAASGGGAAALKALLDGGMSPQDAVTQFNQKYGRTTGNEAVYYDPSQHGGVATIGLPDAYLAKPGSSWDITQRSGSAPTAPPPVKSAASYLSTPTPYVTVPIARALQMPGSAASYLN